MSPAFDSSIDNFCHPGIEKSALSCVVKDPGLLVSSKELSASNFLSTASREFFICIDSLYSRKIDKFTPEVVWNEAKSLKSLKFLNTQDGYEYIKTVVDSIVPASMFGHYLKELLERSEKYRLYEVVDSFKGKILNNVDNIHNSLSFDELVGSVESDLFDLTINKKQNTDAVDFSTFVSGFRERLNEPPVEVLGIKSGMLALDSILNGFKRKSLYVVAARAKNGKSTLLLEWAKYIAYFLGVPVLYIDTEMNEELVMRRLYAQITQISVKDLENRTFSRDPVTIENLDLAQDIIQGGRFKYKNMPRFTPELLRYEIKKFIKQEKDGIVFFDYIKLPDGSDLSLANETQQLGYLTTELKALSNELDIPVLTAVQFNRDAVGRDPKSNYIAGSDRILHYADTLMAIKKLNPKEMAYYKTRYGSYGLVINGMLSIMDSRSTSSGGGVLLQMDLDRASIKEACEQAVDSSEAEAPANE